MNVFFDFPVGDYNMLFDSLEANPIMYHIVRKYETYVWHKLFHVDSTKPSCSKTIDDLDRGRLFYVDADNDVKLRTVNKLLRCSSIEEFFFETVRRRYVKKKETFNEFNLYERESEHNVKKFIAKENLILLFFDSIEKEEEQLLLVRNELVAKNVCLSVSSSSISGLFTPIPMGMAECQRVQEFVRSIDVNLEKLSMKKYSVLSAEIHLPFKLEYYILLDVIMMMDLPWTFDEKHFLKKKCERSFSIYSEGQNVKLDFDTLIRKETTTIHCLHPTHDFQPLTTKQEKEIVRLLEMYVKHRESIKSDYDLFDDREDILNCLRKNLNRQGTLNELRSCVPKLFVKGYSRLCPNKPFIVSEEEALILEKENRVTMTYPLEENLKKYEKIYACQKGFYPGLKKNTLENASIFEYLPICYKINHAEDPKSNLSKYVSAQQIECHNNLKMVNKKEQLYSTKILQENEKGKIPWVLEKILGKNAIRIGTKKSLFSALDAIGAQQNIIGEQVVSHLLNTKRKVNPISFLDVLQEHLNANIVVFNKNGIDPAMLRSRLFFSSEKREYDQLIILFNLGHHYEKIINFDIKLVMEYIYILARQLQLNPLHTRLAGQGNTEISSKLWAQKEKAYFIHDLFHLFEMNRGANDVVYSIQSDNDSETFSLHVLKEVKVLRFSFKDIEEMREYYALLYPTLFDSEKRLILTKKMFDRLNYISEEIPEKRKRYMFFLDILEEKHFTKKMNNVIIISRK